MRTGNTPRVLYGLDCDVHFLTTGNGKLILAHTREPNTLEVANQPLVSL